MAQENRKNIEEPAGSAESCRDKLKIVLLVEDNPDDVDLAVKTIKRYFGPAQNIMHCKTMAETESFVSQRKEEITAVLLDLGLPDTANPGETFTRIRKFSQDVPVVIMTGSQDHALALRLVEEGADDFINKGQLLTSPELLRNAIEFAIRRHELLKESEKKAKTAISEKEQIIAWMGGGYSIGN